MPVHRIRSYSRLGMYPVLFEIPWLGWPIFSYGVMLGLGIILGWYLTMYLVERDGLPREIMGSCYFWGILGSLAGARILYLVANPGRIERLQDLFNLRQGGLVAYGGFLGGLGACYLFCRHKKINIWAWADATAAPIALGLGITRFGCFLYGCCFGRRVTEDDPEWLRALAMQFPNWLVRFPHLAESGGGCCRQDVDGSPAFAQHVREHGLDGAAEASFDVVPTQLLSSINGFIVFGLLIFLRRYRRFRGMLIFTLALYYGLTRFLLEMVRDDAQRGARGPAIFGPLGGHEGQLTTSQFIAVITVVSAAAGLAFFARRAKRDPEAAMALGEGANIETEEKHHRAKPRKGGKKRPKARSKKR